MQTGKTALGVALICAGGALVEGQQPVFRAGADIVAVDVQVVDRTGTPVTGLGPGDFEVRIDRGPRRIRSAEFIELAAAGAASSQPATGQPVPGPPTAAPVGLPEPQLFIVAIDESSFYARHAPAAVHAARRFIEKLPAGVRVGVFAYPHGTGLGIESDRAVALRRLETITGTLDAPTSDFGLSMSEIIDITARDGDVVRRVAERACPREAFRCVKQVETEAQQLAMVFEGQVSASVAGLRGLLRALTALPGRKILVVVTGGLLAADRVGGRPDVAAVIGDVSREAALSNVVLTVLHMDSTFIDAFSARGGGVRASYMRDSAALGAGLDRLAASAGGALVRIEAGNGDYAFDRVLRETSAYYLLGVEPEQADRDGRPHYIEVRVKARRASVQSRTTVVIPKG